MKPKVYLETSILSYLAARPSRDAVTSARQWITKRWWETEREKYSLLVSAAVEAECDRGDPRMVDRRRQLLKEVSLFSINETILGVAKLLIAPGAIPVERRPGCSAHRGSSRGTMRVSPYVEFSSHRQRSHSSASRSDPEESWLHKNDNLHSGRTLLSGSLGKTKFLKPSTRIAMLMPRSTVTI